LEGALGLYANALAMFPTEQRNALLNMYRDVLNSLGGSSAQSIASNLDIRIRQDIQQYLSNINCSTNLENSHNLQPYVEGRD
jgi:hypothetical protein